MQKNQELVRLLQDAFKAPEPQRKQSFLRSLRHRRISNAQFLLQQAAYIKKGTWGLSFAVFLAALAGGHFVDTDILWLLSALMPFLALSAVAEYTRSEVNGMTELEMASRFGLKSVMLARMGILGILHFVTLCLVSLAGCGREISVFRTGIYLLVPYLLTDTIGLWCFRKIKGKEAVYASAGAAVIVGLLPLLSTCVGGWTAQGGAFQRWLAAAVLLCFAAASEWKKSIQRTEELTWN